MSAWFLLSVLFGVSNALAGDDPFEEDEDDGQMPAPVPTGPADDLTRKEPEEIPDAVPVPGAPQPLLVPIEDEDEVGPVAGGDTGADYRAALDTAKGLSTDEEASFWEDYLARFPNTQFNTQIRERIDQLMDDMYNRRINVGPGAVDAMDQEIRIAQGLLLENLNPRTRIQAGLEWGNPDWINLQFDYEHAFARTFSVHGGVRHRYTGWGIDAGPRWAFIKSTRTKSVVSLLGDLHFNTNPAFLSIRPQVAAGKQFGPVDLQIQAGTDVELRSGVELKIIGGANVSWRASETFGLFLETSSLMKSFSWEGDMYRFNTISLGMKFFPLSGEKQDNLDINLAGTAPYSQSYWQYHFGGVDAQLNYWQD